jgi:hypothetical protein
VNPRCGAQSEVERDAGAKKKRSLRAEADRVEHLCFEMPGPRPETLSKVLALTPMHADFTSQASPRRRVGSYTLKPTFPTVPRSRHSDRSSPRSLSEEEVTNLGTAEDR